MARRAAQPLPPPEPLRLLFPRAEAAERIQRQIDEGQALLQALDAREDFEKLETRKREWRDYTKELLARIFSNRDLESEFNYSLATAVRVATWGHSSRAWTLEISRSHFEAESKSCNPSTVGWN